VTVLRIAGPEGEETLTIYDLFVLIGAAPLTAGIEGWLRCDDRGYLVTGPDLVTGSDRSLWPLERDPRSSSPVSPGCSSP